VRIYAAVNKAHTLNVEDQVLILSASEFALLRIFVNHPMRTLTRERLSRLLHDPTGRQANRGIGVQVWRLRHIIESNPSSPRLIQTVRSHGYIFVPDGEQGGTMTVKTSKLPGEPQEPEGYGVDGLPDKLTGPY
jgi:DNA-binding response OmpR family regulator